MQKFLSDKSAVFVLGAVALAGTLLRQDAASTGLGVPAGSGPSAAAMEEIGALRCNPRNAAGVGLRGEYFQQAGGQGHLLLSRVDTAIEFDASLDWPADRRAERPRSARWQGWVKAPISGRYRFHGGPTATITVSGLPMTGPKAPPDAFLEMNAGRYYPIVMEADLAGVSQLRLEWTAPHGVRYVVPRALLFLPTAS